MTLNAEVRPTAPDCARGAVTPSALSAPPESSPTGGELGAHSNRRGDWPVGNGPGGRNSGRTHGEGDLGWLTEQLAPALVAVVDLLERRDSPRWTAAVELAVEASGLTEKGVESLLGGLRNFGLVTKLGVKSQRRLRLTELGRRWLDSDAGREVLRWCAAVARGSSA